MVLLHVRPAGSPGAVNPDGPSRGQASCVAFLGFTRFERARAHTGTRTRNWNEKKETNQTRICPADQELQKESVTRGARQRDDSKRQRPTATTTAIKATKQLQPPQLPNSPTPPRTAQRQRTNSNAVATNNEHERTTQRQSGATAQQHRTAPNNAHRTTNNGQRNDSATTEQRMTLTTQWTE